MASCLKPQVFKTTMATVRKALAEAQAALTPRKRRASGVTYEKLLEDHRLGRRGMIMGWVRGAEQTLWDNMEMQRRFGRAADAVVIAVFCWTCRFMSVRVSLYVALGFEEHAELTRGAGKGAEDRCGRPLGGT